MVLTDLLPSHDGNEGIEAFLVPATAGVARRVSATATRRPAARRGAAATPRAQILLAAAQAIARDGFHGMSMRDLARATGRSLATFYSHFPGKEDVLYALHVEAFDALLASAHVALVGTSAPAERLYVFVLNHLRYMEAHPDLMHVLVHEARALPALRRRAVRERKDAYFRVLHDVVHALMLHGCGKPGSAGQPPHAIEIERVTYALFGMLNWTRGWYNAARHGDVSEVARTLHRIALCGLTTRCAIDLDLFALDARVAAAAASPLVGGGPGAEGTP